MSDATGKESKTSGHAPEIRACARAMELAYFLNSEESLSGAPCRMAFEVARKILEIKYAVYVASAAVDSMIKSGEYEEEDVKRAIDSVLESAYG